MNTMAQNGPRKSLRVGLYADEGAGPLSFRQTWRMWKLAFPEDMIERLKVGDVEDFLERGDLLIFPGGQDLYYHRACSSALLAKIRRFVEEGGTYVGICAGAYFATSAICFYAREDLFVTGRRALQLWKGASYGALYGVEEYSEESEAGACLVEIETTSPYKQQEQEPPLEGPRENSREGPERRFVYYYGGCLLFAQEDPSGEILARYITPFDPKMRPEVKKKIEEHAGSCCVTKANVASIKKSYGKGEVYLFGYHPEYLPHKLPEKEFAPAFLARFHEVSDGAVEHFRSYFQRGC